MLEVPFVSICSMMSWKRTTDGLCAIVSRVISSSTRLCARGVAQWLSGNVNHEAKKRRIARTELCAQVRSLAHLLMRFPGSMVFEWRRPTCMHVASHAMSIADDASSKIANLGRVYSSRANISRCCSPVGVGSG